MPEGCAHRVPRHAFARMQQITESGFEQRHDRRNIFLRSRHYERRSRPEREGVEPDLGASNDAKCAAGPDEQMLPVESAIILSQAGKLGNHGRSGSRKHHFEPHKIVPYIPEAKHARSTRIGRHHATNRWIRSKVYREAQTVRPRRIVDFAKPRSCQNHRAAIKRVDILDALKPVEIDEQLVAAIVRITRPNQPGIRTLNDKPHRVANAIINKRAKFIGRSRAHDARCSSRAIAIASLIGRSIFDWNDRSRIENSAEVVSDRRRGCHHCTIFKAAIGRRIRVLVSIYKAVRQDENGRNQEFSDFAELASLPELSVNSRFSRTRR